MEILQFFQSMQNSFLDVFFQYITMLGENNFYIICMAVIFWCVNKKFGYKLGFAIISNGILNISLKEIFHTARPIGVKGIRSQRIHTAQGYSFPSGHTQGAAAFWTSIMIEVKKKWVYILGGLIIFIIGISRLYLAVHWPIDVLVGWILGISWVFFSNWLFNSVERSGKYYLFLILIVPSVVGMFFFSDSNYFKLTGVLFSFIVGYYIESRFINFNVKCSILKQIIKIIFGVSIILLIKFGVKNILEVSLISEFIRYFLIGIWMIVGAPLIFKIVEKG